MFCKSYVLQCFMLLGHIFCRKCILDPKKLPVMDVIDFAVMSDTDDLPLAVPRHRPNQIWPHLLQERNDKALRFKVQGSRQLRSPDGRTDATRKGLWHPRDLHVWAQPADGKARTCELIAGLEECCQIRLEHEQHQGRFRVA